MARVAHMFESPSSFDACTNSNVKVVYDRELRKDACMSGAFCLHRQFNPGEFICAWNGRQVIDDDEVVQRLTNIYDLTKYALSFPSGCKKQLLYSAPRLDKHGRPARLPEREEDVKDPQDVSLAVFMNEPSPDSAAIYNASEDKVRIVKEKRNSANVCLRTVKQRNGVVCPLMFASRVIRPGEELTWDYGADYDRHFYTIEAEKGVFDVSKDKYSATEAPNNICRITCDTVEFKKGLAIETEFSPDLFLLNAESLTQKDRDQIVFRSDHYLPGRHASDDSTIDNASVDSGTSSEPSITRPTKRRRRHRLQRRTISVESMQKEEMNDFLQQRSELDRFAQEILQRLNDALKIGRIRNPTKLRIIAILKDIIQPAVYLPYEQTTPLGYTVVQHFNRTEFVLSKVDGESFIKADNDVLWKDVIKMQRMLFLAIDSIIDSSKGSKDVTDDIHLKFAPYNFTSIYIRPDYTRETIDDWDNPKFRENHPTAHRVGMQFLHKLAHIQDFIQHYNTWHRMLETFNAKEKQEYCRTNGLDWQKLRLCIELGLNMLHNNAYARVNTPGFFEMCYAVIHILVTSVKVWPIDPIRISEAIDEFKGKLNEFRIGGTEHDSSLAEKMLNALQEPSMWRSESMLLMLSRPNTSSNA